eukprot:CAMPEP_0119560840 /NCGR_PEP_ID=MMETSP1352-20130426/16003_1 /TAXON_ID=265584 /ORGANISM="Stauroneis constricta, Strain CCMP1120" /LENGTH=411 /DNA_ID=CAMNT_0007608901 /DNA_START=262 /DNA_END=1497 /DNA_ORIENTATION=+
MIPSFLSTVFTLSGAPTHEDGRGITSAKQTPGSPRHTPITTKDTARGVVNDGGIMNYAFSGMQGWRMTMEDAHMACTDIPVNGKSELKGHAIFGVMDGHGGDFTSTYAAKHFMTTFSAQTTLKKYHDMKDAKRNDVPGVELLKSALAETFASLDADIRKNQNKRNDTLFAMKEKAPQGADAKNIAFERSGSTCIVVLITPSHIICANAGDSRAILRRKGRSLPLSFDHKPANIPELMRVEKAGGYVKSKRVDGDLAVSRGLGDFTYKSNESVPVEEQKVVPDPEIVCYPRNRKTDEFVVLACDGVWDVLSNQECSAMVQDLLDEGETDLGLICEEAMDMCLQRNSRDNMTISVVGLEAMKISNSYIGHSAVLMRRTARQAKYLEAQARIAATRAAVGVGLVSDKPVAIGAA